MPGIDGRVGEHIPEERAIGVGVGAVEHYMRASNHLLTVVGPEHPEGAVCRARSSLGIAQTGEASVSGRLRDRRRYSELSRLRSAGHIETAALQWALVGHGSDP